MTVFTLMIAGVFAFTACSDDNSPGNQPDGTPLNPTDVPAAVLNAFEKQYPDANNVQWTKKDNYAVATFTKSGDTSGQQSAWFAWDNGTWGMTEYEIPYSLLPDDVRTAFEASEYAASPWHYDREIDVLQRNETETLYVIEVSQGETDVDLYYTEDGILVNEIVDADDDKDYHEFLPQQPTGNITSWLNERYPGHRIVDIDRENNSTEVEIITADGMKCEVLFDSNQQWLYTKTDYSRRNLSQVPENILAFLRGTDNYPGDQAIDDIEKYELNDGSSFYCFELESRYDDDYTIYINETGVISKPILPNLPAGGGDGIAVEDAIRKVIDERYPGATVIEKDYDDGYLEITIRHDNLVKELQFNGRNEWIRSEWEVRQLPDAVTSAIEQGNYTLDDREFDYVETASESWYEVEVRQGRQEMKLYIAPDGNILRTEYDD